MSTQSQIEQAKDQIEALQMRKKQVVEEAKKKGLDASSIQQYKGKMPVPELSRSTQNTQYILQQVKQTVSAQKVSV